MNPSYAQRDQQLLWHPFTWIDAWERQPPLVITHARGCYLYDEAGQRYLDGVSSLWVNLHGHCCPDIDGAVREQLARMAHSTFLGLTHPAAIDLAERLLAVAPANLARVFYSDSGSTAVEVALKIAFQYFQHTGEPRKTRFVALDQAYHGDTIGAVSVGGIDLFHRLFHPLLFDCLRIPAPHPYRFAGSTDECAAHSLQALQVLLSRQASEIAALIIEPRVQGAAGMLVHPPTFLQRVAELCKAHHVLLICDEVATGFGRTGSLFACQAERVAPDFLVLAKGLSGGYLPLAATLTTSTIYDAFRGPRERSFFHGHSFTANPLACAAALASLARFADGSLLEHVRTIGDLLARRLHETFDTHPHVGEIRRCGLMFGIELVADRTTRTPFAADRLVGAAVCHAARRHHLLLRPLGDVVVLLPPLVIDHAEVELLATGLSHALCEVL